ncbi:MAG: hypothetical protein AAFV53_06205 [Myxococcota bacterium]
MKNVVLAVIFLAILTPLRALGADFSGQWTLDSSASESMTPIFDMQEVSWAKRQMASTLDKSFAIVQGADRMTVTYSNALGTIDQVLLFNNQPHTTRNPAGQNVTLKTQWRGETLVSSGSTPVGEAGTGIVTASRTLSQDGNTLNVTINLKSGDQNATVKRVFRRVQ